MIDVYESWLAQNVQNLGYAVDIMFAAHELNIDIDIYHRDDLIKYLSAGMPFVKFKNLLSSKWQAAIAPYCSPLFCKAFLPTYAKHLSKGNHKDGCKK